MLPKNKLRARAARSCGVYRDAAVGAARGAEAAGSSCKRVPDFSARAVSVVSDRSAVTHRREQAECGVLRRTLSFYGTPIAAQNWFVGTGRRKESVARVFLRPGPASSQ